LLLGLAATASVIAWFGVYPFLALSERVPSNVFVVECWMPPEAAEATGKAIVAMGGASLVVVACGLKDVADPYVSGRYGSELLVRAMVDSGISPGAIATCFFPSANRDRTYHAALAVRDWLRTRGTQAQALNVVTLGPHARRSRLMFQSALGPEARVGVVALDPKDYDADRWWNSSAGFRSVVGELVAYLYARFLFVGDSGQAVSGGARDGSYYTAVVRPAMPRDTRECGVY
jgi:hypothetical protein